MLGRQIRRRQRQLFIIQQLKDSLEEELNNISQEAIQIVTTRMNLRLAAVVTVRGGNMRY